MTILLSPSDVVKQKTSRYRILLERVNEQLKEKFNSLAAVTIIIPDTYTEDEILSVCFDLQAASWTVEYVHNVGDKQWELELIANTYGGTILTPDRQHDVWVDMVAKAINAKATTIEMTTYDTDNGLTNVGIVKTATIEDGDLVALLAQLPIVMSVTDMFARRGWRMMMDHGTLPHQRIVSLISDKYQIAL